MSIDTIKKEQMKAFQTEGWSIHKRNEKIY